MSDTLIFSRPHRAPTEPALEPVARLDPKHCFAARLWRGNGSAANRKLALDDTTTPLGQVEVIESAPTQKYSLMELINALLADAPPRREHLLALRAQLRRCASGVNVLSNLLTLLSQNSRHRKD
ncbi:MAG: hypothetical protein JNK82_21570 [Myxococcaceae bacterium]|nr:hypothetical protein [Myxococcaceae bacterium]